MLDIIEPSTPDQLNAVRRLCWDYRDFLLSVEPSDKEVTATFYPRDKYAELMERLEQEHARPNGAIRLARKDGNPVGCGMFRTLEPGTAEIKRVFVNEAARGTGAGFAIMTNLINQCRADGFNRILLDTGSELVAAQRLYQSMGFTLRGPYYDVPDIAKDVLVFYEMQL
ncbi:GNAT family N-acetyltransferase [Primorskyibacter sp. S87]|uniref:GNAT family N-acetyltransferase n=1 Tax=Primorskyibacter sp. S87 TaxID=3415126 RepID=UPI003C7E1A7C